MDINAFSRSFFHEMAGISLMVLNEVRKISRLSKGVEIA